ncbi:MAG: hypothetical protein ACRD9R_16980, partial [Pyrinomonadaceae bacterium]
ATPLGESEPFRRAVSRLAQGADAAAIVTLTAEREEAREFVNFIARLKGLRQTTPDPRAFDAALAKLPYAATETHLLDGGVERRTLSAFGQLAAIVRQFGVGAPGAVSEQRARVGVSTPSD